MFSRVVLMFCMLFSGLGVINISMMVALGVSRCPNASLRLLSAEDLVNSIFSAV